MLLILQRTSSSSSLLLDSDDPATPCKLMHVLHKHTLYTQTERPFICLVPETEPVPLSHPLTESNTKLSQTSTWVIALKLALKWSSSCEEMTSCMWNSAIKDASFICFLSCDCPVFTAFCFLILICGTFLMFELSAAGSNSHVLQTIYGHKTSTFRWILKYFLFQMMEPI